ncbi:hypothetical protein AAG906_033185 [Vitis piasezkii]
MESLQYVMIEHLCLALVWATKRLRHYMTEYSVHLISRLDPLRYLSDRLALTEFDIQYVSQKSIKGSIVVDHLASLPTSEDRPVDDDCPDKEFVVVTSLSEWCMYFDGVTNQSGHEIETPLEFGIRQMKVFDDSNLVLRQIQGDWKTRGVNLRSYHAYLELLVGRFDDLRYVHLPRAQNRFANTLATLASFVDISIDMGIRPLLIELRSAPAYCCLIGEIEKCLECQIHGDLIHAPPSELHALTSTWPFLVWGIDIIGKISPKYSSGHEFILVAIDYFTKWVEAASYVRLTSARVASFIRPHIICRYGVPHELISDRGVHFRAEVDTLLQKYNIQHHRSSAYMPQTNGVVEVATKNIKRILRKMVETSRDWLEKLPFALWAYRTFFRTST